MPGDQEGRKRPEVNAQVPALAGLRRPLAWSAEHFCFCSLFHHLLQIDIASRANLERARRYRRHKVMPLVGDGDGWLCDGDGKGERRVRVGGQVGIQSKGLGPWDQTPLADHDVTPIRGHGINTSSTPVAPSRSATDATYGGMQRMGMGAILTGSGSVGTDATAGLAVAVYKRYCCLHCCRCHPLRSAEEFRNAAAVRHWPAFAEPMRLGKSAIGLAGKLRRAIPSWAELW